MAYHHCMAKCCLKTKSEARNLSSCKSMVDGLTIMLGVFINLLYTHTMKNNHSVEPSCCYTPTPTLSERSLKLQISFEVPKIF